MSNPYFNFDNRFSQLPQSFYTKLQTQKITANPSLVHFNPLACELIDLAPKYFDQQEFIEMLSGNRYPQGSDPLAMVYSGHQFGVWAGQLGDGRALLLGQIRNHKNQLWDIQLKGSGTTPYSRMGDGKAVMRSSIREYLCAEAMNALGIATTRSLCLIATNELVWREQQEPGAILTRLAQTHIRFGHFEHFYYTQQWEHLQQLADHVIECYFSSPNQTKLTYGEWFYEVLERTAKMIAQWMAVGFCHGVMNTDNMSITGLTIDYGPYGFLETTDPAHICNHSDESGRYAYNQQPAVALWNLQALAHALQPILPTEESSEILQHYPKLFDQHYHMLMRHKLGLAENDNSHDDLWHDLLVLLREHQADYSLGFGLLHEALIQPENWLNLFQIDKIHEIKEWLKRFKHAHQLMDEHSPSPKMTTLQNRLQLKNPTYVLRNWVSEFVIRAVEDEHDYRTLNDVLTLLQNPFNRRNVAKTMEDFSQPAPERFKNLILSCSS